MGRNNDGQHYQPMNPGADSGERRHRAPGTVVGPSAAGGEGSSYPGSSLQKPARNADVSTESYLPGQKGWRPHSTK